MSCKTDHRGSPRDVTWLYPTRTEGWVKSSRVIRKHTASTRTATLSHSEVDDGSIQLEYLRRIGFSQVEADALVSNEPCLEDLQRLLSSHLMAVPFENMDLHTHPAHGGFPGVPRKRKLPSLDVSQSLDKIVRRNRGGFCFELNLSFHWLLSSLGYDARMALSDTLPDQEIPGHVVVLVDNLMDVPVLVDVGFGVLGACDVLLPVRLNAPTMDNHGNVFEFKADSTDRFDTVLYRTRVNEPEVERPMYWFCISDDMEATATEFQEGLDRVLTKSRTFNGKRICVLGCDRGHTTLGKDYIKWVEKGVTVKHIQLPDETAWREALLRHFGILLTPEEQ